MIDLNQHTLDLEYPCLWQYKVVIRHEQTIDNIIKEVIDKREHNIKPSKKSSGGKFKSYTLELLVHNEDDRKELYQILMDHEHIKMVV
jgi:putative lipoic acid-binding regulatory protein